jgi:hypothetical protein
MNNVVSSETQLRLSQLLRRNAVAIQGAFATLWGLRLAGLVGAWEVPIAVAIVSIVIARRAFRATAPSRARDEFRTAEGRAFMRPIAMMTVVQIVASILLPAIGEMLGRRDLALTIVALTITVFFWFFAVPLQIPAVRRLAAAATIAVVVVPLIARDDALNASVSAVMSAWLLVSAGLCESAARSDSSRITRALCSVS